MEYIGHVQKLFMYYKELGEKSINQLSESEIRDATNGNSIAIIVKHLSGNMKSRWTNFLEEDGEKSWRNREMEFVDDFEDMDQLWAYWNDGWKLLLDTLESISDDQLEQIIYIRNEGHTVIEAINRQLAHYSYHIGQIVILAKMYRKEEWEFLSIPPGKSKAYNDQKFDKDQSRSFFTKNVHSKCKE